jgi:hypothetical protein
MGNVWRLGKDSNYIVTGINGSKIAGFNLKPSMKKILNLFKNRKKGTIYFELWKWTGNGEYMFDSRLRVMRWRTEYTRILQKELNVESIKQKRI